MASSKGFANRSYPSLVSAVSGVSKENQTEPLDNYRVVAKQPPQNIGDAASNGTPLKKKLQIYLHIVAFNPDRIL